MAILSFLESLPSGENPEEFLDQYQPVVPFSQMPHTASKVMDAALNLLCVLCLGASFQNWIQSSALQPLLGRPVMSSLQILLYPSTLRFITFSTL